MIEADTLIAHGTIITINAARHVLIDGAIALKADRVVARGKAAEAIVGCSGLSSITR
jgi:hypothetical protein